MFNKLAPSLRRRPRSNSRADGSTRFNDVDQIYDVSGSLMLGCWNLQYFRTDQLYFKSIFDYFDIFGISEHSLFQEQLELIKAATGNTYNCHPASASDSPAVVSGKIAHVGVALLCKYAIIVFITPLETINSDCIMGIKCDFPNYSALFILSVYLPSMNDKTENFNEYFDHLWALYDTVSTDSYVIVLGDFNGDLGVL